MYSYGENKGSTSNKCTHSTNGVYLYGIVYNLIFVVARTICKLSTSSCHTY